MRKGGLLCDEAQKTIHQLYCEWDAGDLFFTCQVIYEL
jgi:hypothetical protein